MSARWKVPLFFVLILGVAYGCRQLIAPHAIPVADGEQSGWRLQIAFLLKSIEYVGLFGSGISLVIAGLAWAKSRVSK